MKLQLDTKNKTIKVEENVNIEEFYIIIKKMLPNDLWKEFTLETNTVVNYSPWIIWHYVSPYFPGPRETTDPYPWYTISSEGTSANVNNKHTLTDGVYNINAIV